MPTTADQTTQIICAKCTSTVPTADTCPSCNHPTALDDRYRLADVVGRGSFGMTYRATRIADGKTVAIKEMLIRRADTVKSVELFEREARVLAQLDHPGIPRYIDDLWHEDGRSTAFFLVQEFIEGDVVEQTHANRPNRPDDVFEMLGELLDILVYLHEFSPPVVHRDVKPANLMVRDDGSLVLIDFGSVQAALNPDEGGSTVAGTFGYMAPEQFTGQATPKSDVYGAGATAVALLSGQEPNATPGKTPDLSRLNIAPAHRQLLEQMLTPAPDDRPSGAEAATELRNLGNSAGTGSDAVAPFDASGVQAVSTLPAVPPRELPAEFHRTFETNYHRDLLLSLLPATLFGVVCLFEPGLFVLSMTLGTAFLFPFAWLYNLVDRRKTREQILEQGVTAPGLIRGRTCTFEINGAQYAGKVHGHSPSIGAADPVPATVLYLPDNPNKNLVITDDVAEHLERLPQVE